jgi:DNA polymerase-3 subunit alpha
MEFDLLFERFLNPDRISMPDIDIDIQDTRRDEVIAYCTEKYGAPRVANITTFGTMAARAAYKDVARVLEVPYAEADRISKLIPPPQQGHHQKLADSIKNDADLRAEYEANPTAKR